MTSKNDITGDEISTKAPSEAYRDNWDRIFGKKNEVTPERMKELSEKLRDQMHDEIESMDATIGDGLDHEECALPPAQPVLYSVLNDPVRMKKLQDEGISEPAVKYILERHAESARDSPADFKFFPEIEVEPYEIEVDGEIWRKRDEISPKDFIAGLEAELGMTLEEIGKKLDEGHK